jgi:hypothetical protein
MALAHRPKLALRHPSFLKGFTVLHSTKEIAKDFLFTNKLVAAKAAKPCL